MQHIRQLALSGALAFALLPSLSAGPAVADAQARSLELSLTGLQFTSFTCLNDPCTLAHVTTTANATSNLATGPGTADGDLIIDFSPGGSCNIVDESVTFAFAADDIFEHSHHEDCATHGLRIDTTFEITGGTGAFHGATGNGREQGGASGPAALNYIGTINL
jgi:hypothetical protein